MTTPSYLPSLFPMTLHSHLSDIDGILVTHSNDLRAMKRHHDDVEEDHKIHQAGIENQLDEVKEMLMLLLDMVAMQNTDDVTDSQIGDDCCFLGIGEAKYLKKLILARKPVYK